MKSYFISYEKEHKLQNIIVNAQNMLAASVYFLFISPDVVPLGIREATKYDLMVSMQNITAPEITKEMMDKLPGLSTYDLANELRLPHDMLLLFIANKKAEGTACFNCRNVGERMKGLCNSCSRIAKDMYECFF